MQVRFDFLRTGEIGRWRAALEPLLADVEIVPRRKPIGTLVKSLISGRTRDEVSLPGLSALRERYRSAAGIAAARPVATLQRIAEERPDYCLDLLGGLPLEDALAWLERLPGVGRKVAARRSTPARSTGR